MKKILYLFVVLSIAFNCVSAQEVTEEVPERLKYFKEKYEETFQVPFEVVWASVKENIIAIGAQVGQEKYSQDDEGLFKGVIRSDNYVFTEGSDSTYRVLQKYQKDMKYIPGGIWDNGRISYKIILKEVETNVVKMTLTSQMSAMESYVSQEYHFWQSNGLLEKEFIDNLKELISKNNL